jgi:hypothetical protein
MEEVTLPVLEEECYKECGVKIHLQSFTCLERQIITILYNFFTGLKSRDLFLIPRSLARVLAQTSSFSFLLGSCCTPLN